MAHYTKLRAEQMLFDGWFPLTTVVPTRSDNSDPQFEITFASVDLTGDLTVGQRMKFTQDSTVRYFIVVAVTLDGSDTDVILYGGTDYDVADTASYAISDLFYSPVKAPTGFPLDPEVWTQTATGASAQSNPVSGTWYNIGGSVTMPVGEWFTRYSVEMQSRDSSGGNDYIYNAVGVDTSNNSSTSAWLRSHRINMSGTNVWYYLDSPMYNEYSITVSSQTTYYLNARVNYDTDIDSIELSSSSFLKATCAYL